MFDIINEYYGQGYYDNNDLKIFVHKGDITSEEYKQITSE
jgi:uncharacterized XkdX family phage protein